MTRPRQPPYRRVVVRGLTWEGHNHYHDRGPVHNADEELYMVMNAFDTYGYTVKRMKVPQDSTHRSAFPRILKDRLADDARSSRSTLVILYYQGHGTLDKQGHLVLHNGKGAAMHWSDVANAIFNAPCDVLAILNCCHAGAALRYHPPRADINYERHVKQIMYAAPAEYRSGWGSARGFAACLEQALRERRTEWDPGFEGTPSHWIHAINRNMTEKRGEQGRGGVQHIVKPPENRKDQPIRLGPYSSC